LEADHETLGDSVPSAAISVSAALYPASTRSVKLSVILVQVATGGPVPAPAIDSPMT
jgi:hypothetical protein